MGPMTKYRTATYIGLTPMTFLWGVTQVTDYLTRMHTAHFANVSKSVTKNATFPRTGGLPCLITHSCMSATSPTIVGGLIFCISATPIRDPCSHYSMVQPVVEPMDRFTALIITSSHHLCLLSASSYHHSPHLFRSPRPR